MPIFKADRQLVYFAHVPKCAGSAIENYIMRRFDHPVMLNRKFYDTPEPARWSRTSPQHIAFEDLELLIPHRFFDHSFTMVRHPVDRMISMYHFNTEVGHDRIRGLSFSDWLRALEQSRGTDLFHLDNHPRPMSDFIGPDATVFHLENGDKPLIAYLDGIAGNSDGARALPDINRRQHRRLEEDLSPRIEPKADDIALIRDVYAADFERFGYDTWKSPKMKTKTSPDLMPRVLVFGQSGQVAQALGEYEGVNCLDRVQADLTDPDACVKHIEETDADVIINAAAYTAVDKAEQDVDLATQINGTTVTAMAAAAAKRGIPFLHISTDYVFDGKGKGARLPSVPTDPQNVYGHTKLIGEQGVIAAKGPHVILRTSWVFSAVGSNFVKTMLNLGQERAELWVVGDQFGAPTAAHDIAAALMSIARQFKAGAGVSGTYHFCSQPDISWAGFAMAIFEQAGITTKVHNIPTSKYPTPAKRPLNSRLDCSTLKRDYDIIQPTWRGSLKQVLKILGTSS